MAILVDLPWSLQLKLILKEAEETTVSAIEALKRCEIFIGLDNDDLQKIVDLPSCQERTYQPQEVIFSAGQAAEHLYALVEGKVDLVTGLPTSPSKSSSPTLITIIGKGSIFGWSALVSPHIFSLTAIAKASVQVLTIGGSDIRNLFELHPHIGYEVTRSLLQVIASRFRTIEQLLVTGKRSILFEVPKWTGR
jgi:CRP-like cAMP-binding protein